MLSIARSPCDDPARMRGIVLALLAASGCNWVFGLDHAVHAWDAGPPKMDAPPVASTSSYLKLAITTPDLCTALSTCTTPPAIDFEPFGADPVRPERPVVRVGPLVAQGADQPIPDLLPDPVPYNVADGSFAVPTSVTTGAWRAVITLPGDPLPHEVQWNLDDSHHGTLIVPSTTRLQAPAVPMGSGYDLTPVGGPMFVGPTIMTTGVFTYGLASANGTTAKLDFSAAKPIDGPTGAPQASKGDLVILTETAAQGNNESSVDGWAVTSVDLQLGAHSTPATQPMWHRPTPQKIPGVDFNVTTNQARLTSALGSLYSGKPFAYRWTYGFSPNLGTFGFGEPAAPDYLEQPIILPIDVLTPVATPPSHMTFIDIDTSAVPLPRALYAAMTDQRTLPSGACPSGVAGLRLTSGYATLIAGSSDHSAALQIGDFPALMARNEQLAGLDLGNTDCGSTLTATTSSLDLTWSLEPPVGLATSADDYEVVLYHIMPGSPATLHPVRSYRVTAPLVQVDGALLESGQYYVFGITSHWGFPNASAADYTKSRTPPFGSTTKFAAVFHVQ